jgi:hypothetical protein
VLPVVKPLVHMLDKDAAAAECRSVEYCYARALMVRPADASCMESCSVGSD